ncbi:MAG: MFS transporter [Clostridia bacterium]|nr:MFS transporter [Clostridia bacterium]
MKQRKYNFKQTARVLSLAWVYMTAFLLPYIQYTFYEPLREGLGVSHEQLGSLISMYAIICFFAYIPGGWVADRFSLKKILMISMAANILVCVWMAVSFTWTTALIVWGLCAFTSGAACWAALIKGVGLSGESDEQGKVWGLYEFGDALLGFIVSYINLAIFAKFQATLGITSVFMSIAVISGIAVVLIKLFFHDTEADDIQIAEKTKITDIVKVLRLPVVWYVSLAIMSNYLVYAGMTYFTPYLTDVLGLSIVTGTALVVFRNNGLRMMAGPTFGYFADRKESALKIISIGMIATAVLIVAFIMLSSIVPAAAVIAVFFIATFTLLGSRGIIFASLDEVSIPHNVRGLAVAVVSMIAYTPDLVIYKFYGGFLDKYGNDGYSRIFGFLVIMSVLTVGFCLLAIRANKKAKLNS